MASVGTGDPLGALVRTVGPMHWAALLGVIGVVAAATFWAFTGTVATRVSGRGILVRPGGVSTVQSTLAGQIVTICVNPGDRVEEGETVAEVIVDDSQDAFGRRRPIRAVCRGFVLEVTVNTGGMVSVGTSLLTIENVDASKPALQAMLYVPLTEAVKLKPDMPVHLSPSTASREEFGFLVGRIKSIGAFPVTGQAAMSRLSNQQLVDTMLANGPMLAVVVDLIPDPTAISGYKWSSGNGPPTKLVRGTLCDARFTVRRQRPCDLVIPGLKNLTGLADRAG